MCSDSLSTRTACVSPTSYTGFASKAQIDNLSASKNTRIRRRVVLCESRDEVNLGFNGVHGADRLPFPVSDTNSKLHEALSSRSPSSSRGGF